ncbi:hypothetical protein ACSW8S_18460 (plasmid) [Clostridium perfringens]
MFNKIKESINKFFKEVSEDVKKIDISSYFTDTSKLPLLILIIVFSGILIFNMGLTTLFKGIFFLTIFFFLFVWRK